MIALLKREFYIFKHNLISYICIWTLLPMSMYLFISIPLSHHIRTDVINYLNWSSIGNAISASSVLVYVVSLNSILKYKYTTSFSKMMLSSPRTNSQHLMAIVLWSTGVGLIQFLFSLALTQSLNSSNLFITDIILILLYALPIIVIVSNLAIFIGLIVSSSFIRVFLTSILAIFLLFGSGLFIPLEGAPAFFHYSPLYYTILNIQNIITIDSSIVYPSIIVFVISVIIFIINLIVSHKVFRT